MEKDLSHMNELASNEHRKTELTGNLSSLADRTAIVHKADHEGIIEINPMTGHVLTLLDERPEWATELTVAQIAERHGFYSHHLGAKYEGDLVIPEAFAFEDLSWTCARPMPEDHDAEQAQSQDLNYDGFEHYEVEASQEWRSEFLATTLGITGDIEALEAELIGEAVPGSSESVTVDISEALYADNFRTQEELEELAKDRAKGFEKVSATS
jgi:hypothetical protein